MKKICRFDENEILLLKKSKIVLIFECKQIIPDVKTGVSQFKKSIIRDIFEVRDMVQVTKSLVHQYFEKTNSLNLALELHNQKILNINKNFDEGLGIIGCHLKKIDDIGDKDIQQVLASILNVLTDLTEMSKSDSGLDSDLLLLHSKGFIDILRVLASKIEELRKNMIKNNETINLLRSNLKKVEAELDMNYIHKDVHGSELKNISMQLEKKRAQELDEFEKMSENVRILTQKYNTTFKERKNFEKLYNESRSSIETTLHINNQLQKDISERDQQIGQLRKSLESQSAKLRDNMLALCELADQNQKLKKIRSLLIGKEWKDDSLVSDCEICATQFTLTNRKHHCRFCGLVFC
ncbi:Early endosome antigen 1 [Thelohanellus kitauei]|uniref:Early endosome antigen 1 n=1 Tax=Thelohanellus kitauei TaxID=669202 RepID=A0A0C2MNJ0_THEKT|nr:Early endosome antigen 1 [Thelohanellus kitauei]